MYAIGYNYYPKSYVTKYIFKIPKSWAIPLQIVHRFKVKMFLLNPRILRNQILKKSIRSWMIDLASHLGHYLKDKSNSPNKWKIFLAPKLKVWDSMIRPKLHLNFRPRISFNCIKIIIHLWKPNNSYCSKRSL